MPRTTKWPPGVAIVVENFAQSFISQGLVVSPSTEKLAIRPAPFIVARDGSERSEEIRAFSDWVKAIHSGA